MAAFRAGWLWCVLVLVAACGGGGSSEHDAGPADDAAPVEDAAVEPDATIELVSVTIEPASPPTVPLGLGVELSATAHYSDGSDDNVTSSADWFSSDFGVATVNSGIVASVAVGSTTITASFQGESGQATVVVGDPTLLAIAVDPPSASIFAGDSQQFTASGTFTNGVADVTATAVWDSNDDLVATPSAVGGEEGLLLGLDVGSVTVTATLSGMSDTATLGVTIPPIGTHPSNPGDDCTDLLAQGVTTDGPYWIDPDADGNPADAFQTYCDMTTDGGGWSLVVWSDSVATAPLGIPYPGLAPCAGLGCTRGSAAGDPEMQELLQRSTEFGLAQSTTAGTSVMPLGLFEYAGKYTYGPLTTMDLVYGAVTCSASGSWTGQFRTLVGPTTYDNTIVYLAQSLAYATYNFSSDANTYIWNVGVGTSVCNGNGAMPGSWSGTWSGSQYGPYLLSQGRRAMFVRGGTAPSLGQTPGNPGDSCLHILNAGSSIGDGLYWIDPQDTGAFQVRCDMTTAGGGWTVTYDVDASYFDAVFMNNFTASSTPPLTQNAQADIWNAEAVMPVSETLFGCGQQNNAALYYWHYNVATPHTFYANTATDYTYQTISSTATNGTAATCMSTHKAGTTFGFNIIESTNCGNCQNILFGMYHYVSISPGCNTTSTTYGNHASPWNGRSITYPVCNLQQTSNGRFWMAVR